MSDTPTPRTDAAAYGNAFDKALGIPPSSVSIDFARQLERELAEAKAERRVTGGILWFCENTAASVIDNAISKTHCPTRLERLEAKCDSLRAELAEAKQIKELDEQELHSLMTELTEAKAEVSTWRQGGSMGRYYEVGKEQWEGIQRELSTLRTELVTLQQDKERLDWLEKHSVTFPTDTVQTIKFETPRQNTDDYEKPTVRSAIDAAMKGDK